MREIPRPRGCLVTWRPVVKMSYRWHEGEAHDPEGRLVARGRRDWNGAGEVWEPVGDYLRRRGDGLG